VEFHHVVPYAADGRATVDNIELRCRAHNRYEAEVFFGPSRRHLPAGAGAEGLQSSVSVATRFRSRTKLLAADRRVAKNEWAGDEAVAEDWRTPPRPRSHPGGSVV